MARRLKTTPFARFLIAMLFIVPAAYIGAAYYNGEDPIQLIKDKLGIEDQASETVIASDSMSDEETYDLRVKIEMLEREIEKLKEENAALHKEIEQLKTDRE